MQKVLVICGPTATGKTDLALYLAKKFNGEIISADSRQVYRGMDIGTGKDLPENIKTKDDKRLGRYYEIKGIALWGYDLASPKEEYSVGRYVIYARRVIREIIKKGKLPIVTGGTGLYIKALIDGIETARIPKNDALRKNLAGRTAEELFEILAQLDSIKAAALNASDRKNPRRLARAIEISQWRLDRGQIKKEVSYPKYECLFVGLSAPKETLYARVESRVQSRVQKGFLSEVEQLLKEGVDWEYQAMSSFGYRQLRDYFEKKISLAEAIANWVKEEKKYVKRQLTWWKKDERIKWSDISEADWKEKVENMVKRWYATSYAEKG